MSHLILIPFEGLGELRFDTLRDDVHAAIGNDFKSFRRGSSRSITDFYIKLGLQLSFDPDHNSLEFIEAIPPECVSVYQGVDLMGSVEMIVQELARLGYKGTRDDVGYSFDESGFGLYAPVDTIEAVSVFRPGYYDRRPS